jgi:5-methylcytosine-specific restriction endonuclease McrA
MFSLCLRIRSDYTLSKYLGKSALGNSSGGPFKFILGARDNFRRVDVGFKNNELGLYLVVDSTEDDYVESVRSALQEKLSAQLDWPSMSNRVNRAYNIKLTTSEQCDAVLEWLSSERVPNNRRVRYRKSKTAKLKSEKPELFETTSDNEKLEANTSRLIEEGLDEEPVGNPQPERSDPHESRGPFKRDPEVIAWVKQRAGGICELCEKEGPFLDKDNHSFLEVHHIVSLADGGSDTVDNAVALCPNCHRECHHGQNFEDLKNRLLQKVSAIK